MSSPAAKQSPQPSPRATAKRAIPSKPPLTETKRADLASQRAALRFGRSGYAMIPHLFFTVLPRKKPQSEAMYFAIGYIMDRTFGMTPARAEGGAPPEWVKISLGELSKMWGVDRDGKPRMTPSAFGYALEEACRLHLVEREPAGGRAFKYRVFPESWEDLPDYQSPVKTAEADAPEADAPEADAPEADAPEADAPEATVMVVASGKSAKRMEFSEPVRYFQPRNESGLALRFVTSMDRGGTVRFTIRDGRTEGERLSTGVDTQRSDSAVPMSTAVDIGKNPSFSNQRLNDFRSYISLASLKYFPKAADAVLISRVVEACGEATLEEYSTLVELRCNTTGFKDAARRGKNTLGLLIELAKDAALIGGAGADLRRETDSQVARLVAAGSSPDQAAKQIALWRDAHEDVDRLIAKAERWAKMSPDQIEAEMQRLESSMRR